MAVLSKEEFFERLHSMLGDDVSEEAITFLEDMTDTYNDLMQKIEGDGTDWKKKYDELDESWKHRYRHRFFTGESAPITTDTAETQVLEPDEISIEDLFEEKE